MFNKQLGRRVARLASRQEGLISRAQALDVGFTFRQIDGLLARHQWEPARPGVYAIAGAPESWRRSLWAAVLWAGDGAVLSHRCAGALWRLDGIAEHPPELWVPHARAPRAPGVRRTLFLADIDRRVVERLPVTAPARTIIDLAAILSDEALEVAFESARKRRLVTARQLEARAIELCGPGRRGSAAVRRLLALQQPGDAALESPLEVRIWRMLRRSGLPLPERQHWVRIAGRRFRLDFAWIDRLCALEGEGWDAHGGRVAWKRDRQRLALLGSHGWRVIPVTWDDVTRTPAETTRMIANALRRSPPLNAQPPSRGSTVQ